LDAPQRAKVIVTPESAGAASGAGMATGSDVIIADPPRKGLDRELIEYLVKCPPSRFLYISCGLESFVGDLERLGDLGANLRLVELKAFNQMPFTDHVETVARFERAAAPSLAP
jgi:tRNA/tmRNA/rRNA uracil-C5-methylase (TrmA/RlmC/RlmD family)